MTSTWTSFEDFERDIWEASELQINVDKEFVPPKTILEWYSRMTDNTKLSVFENKPTGTVRLSAGRGKFFYNNFTHIPLNEPDRNDLEIKKLIREVSGLGYSNELIEKNIKIKQQRKLNLKKNVPCQEQVKENMVLRVPQKKENVIQMSTDTDSSNEEIVSNIEGSTETIEHISPIPTRNSMLNFKFNIVI